MKKRSVLPVFLLISFHIYAQTLAPEVIASSGGYFNASGASLSWTLGEAVVETFTAGNNILTQGFHQPDLTITGLNDKLDAYALYVFPNPASEKIYFRAESAGLHSLLIKVYDPLLQLVFSEDRSGSGLLKPVDLSGLAIGSYLLTILPDGEENPRSFKIIKTH